MDDIADKALHAGGEVVLSKTKSNLESIVSGTSTGQLVNALGLSPVLVDRNGDYNIKVGFDEYRKDGSSNAMVANIIEYGKHGQPARPFLKNAKNAKSTVDCQSLMLDSISRSDTIPGMDIRTNDAKVGHEAKIGRISEEAIFYLMSRGISEENAKSMIVSGFAEPISKELPLEYAVEMNNLIKLEMDKNM